MILTIIILLSTVIGIIINDQNSKKTDITLENIKNSINSVENAVEKSSSIIEEKETAHLEKSFEDFDPELKFRVYGFSPDIREPHVLRASVENTHAVHTYLKTKWTVTGEICTEDGKVWISNFNYSNRTEFDLSKNEEKVVRIEIPDKLFELAKGKSFLMMVELEMNPFTPSGGSVDTIEIPKKSFIQFDYNEERYQNWLPWTNPSGDLDCVKEPSIWGDTYLNTTSIDDFYGYSKWEFPEE